MRRISVTLLSISLSFGIQAAAQSSDWKVVSVEECAFSVVMPGDVHSTTDTTQVGDGMMGVEISYIAGIYTATCMVYPERLVMLIGGEGLLDSWLQLFANTVKVKLEKISTLVLGKHNGRAFSGTDTINEEDPLYYVDGRVFSVHNKLIMLMATRQNRDEGQRDLSRFLTSLELN